MSSYLKYRKRVDVVVPNGEGGRRMSRTRGGGGKDSFRGSRPPEGEKRSRAWEEGTTVAGIVSRLLFPRDNPKTSITTSLD